MSDSLREQLRKSGIAKQIRDSRPARRKPHRATGEGDPDGRMDLARAWALRRRAEATELERTKAEAQAAARARRQRRQRLRSAVHGKERNLADAGHVRHFEYRGKIRRVHVDRAQLAALNEGRLGVVQVEGHYLVVEREVAEQVHAFAPDHVALLVEPGVEAADDGVPDDLTW